MKINMLVIHILHAALIKLNICREFNTFSHIQPTDRYHLKKTMN